MLYQYRASAGNRPKRKSVALYITKALILFNSDRLSFIKCHAKVLHTWYSVFQTALSIETGVQSVEFTIIWLDSYDAILDFSESTPVCLSHAERVAQLYAACRGAITCRAADELPCYAYLDTLQRGKIILGATWRPL